MYDIAFYDASITWPEATYTATCSAIEPEVTVPGLTAGTDYEVSFANNVKAGTASVTVTGKGAYSGEDTHTFTIAKAAQTITAKASVSKTFKASSAAKKLSAKKTVDLAKLAGVSAKTTVKYKKANKAGASKITVNTKTGKVTLKKGLSRGTYKVKVKLTAAGNATYAAASKIITLKVKVK